MVIASTNKPLFVVLLKPKIQLNYLYQVCAYSHYAGKI